MKSLVHYPILFIVAAVVLATAGLVHAQPTPPTVSTLPASAVGATNATLNGTANPDGLAMSGWFEWGATTNYGNITPAQALGSAGGNTNFSQVLSGLAVGVRYHFRAVASNSFYVVYGTNQSFTTPDFSLAITNLPGVFQSSSAWGDYDNDGRLDILLNGNLNPGEICQVWRNRGSDFTNINAGLTGVERGSVAWGDYDNDGQLDILLTGASGSGVISQVWRNTGNGFTNINAGLPGVFYSSGAWGDYDNDGRLDILLTGNMNPGVISQIWRNTGSGFTLSAGLPGVFLGSAAWGDYDNDGRLDILLSGRDANSLAISQVWRNIGNGFTNINAGLPGVSDSSVAWADYDNDGRLDILLAGESATGRITQVWRNTGSGFTNINAGLTAVRYASVAWGDYDNDGRTDILLTGRDTNNLTTSQVWRNSGSGFTNINAGLPGVTESSAAWGDYDNDGRLDILLTGTGIARVWRNHYPAATNTLPAAPGGLNAMISAAVVTLSWNGTTDAQTPATALTYNLRVGTNSGGGTIVSSMAATSGYRRVPRLGNVQRRLTAAVPISVQLGQNYYWSVQAVDGGFAGSPFAPERSFSLGVVLAPPNGSPVPGDLNGDGVVDETELNVVLGNYFPNSQFLQMTNVAGLGGTNVTFALNNSQAGAFSVEYTTNFANWYFLGPATQRYLFIDTNAPAVPQRYYRLRWP